MGILTIAALRVGNAHVAQHLNGFGLRLRALEPLMITDGLRDLPADGLERIQAGHGVLHHHGDAPAANLLPFLFGFQLGQVLSLKENAAAVDIAVLIQQPHKGLVQHALAGAGLAHHRQRLALIQIKGHASDGVERFPAQGELHVQVPHREDDIAVLFHMCILLTDGSWDRPRPQRRCRSCKSRW